ncbi:GNAT family N-acetyltransferase [Psychrobacillus sp.]|uniref:GNAT family N-acetyltransferase n=1 Tax=Psychrobacillus sp. TaxID=1871623 RepID=UPI0028BE8894|nr:GNAT family N-acetyltransferase [Psychrobacillus sp.]
MQISMMTVSIPIDAETLGEIKELLAHTLGEDKVDYASVISAGELGDAHLKGFCVLAYNDDTDQLVGVLTAVDRIATLDYEWSGLVLPSARKQGIGEQLVAELSRNLELRGAETELVLVPGEAKEGKKLLGKLGYMHDFSEYTMVASAEENALANKVKIFPFDGTDDNALVDILASAFEETEEEARELIAFNTVTPNRRLMLATSDDVAVGTVAIVDDVDKLWVTGLAVHPKARRKGIATAILNWSKHEAHLLGKSSVCLDVETDNENALSVYEKAGFRTTNHTNLYRKG